VLCTLWLLYITTVWCCRWYGNAAEVNGVRRPAWRLVTKGQRLGWPRYRCTVPCTESRLAHDTATSAAARERRFHLITDVSSPSRHRTTSNGFMRFRGGESIGLRASNALNGPIYHRATLIHLPSPACRYVILPLSRLSKFAFLTASLDSTSSPVRPLCCLYARSGAPEEFTGRPAGRLPSGASPSIGRTPTLLTGIQMTA